jgi:hypothetical protein
MKLSDESDACIMLSVNPRPKSPRMVPGAASNDFVDPIIVLTVFIALFPPRIQATTVPDDMNDTSSLKNGFARCIE